MSDKFLFVYSILFMAFVFLIKWSVYYMECNYNNISSIFQAFILIIMFGMLVFGDNSARLVVLFFIVILLVVFIIESVFSFEGIASEVVKKNVDCKFGSA